MSKHIRLNHKRMTAMVMAGVMTCTLPLAGCSKAKNSVDATEPATVSGTKPDVTVTPTKATPDDTVADPKGGDRSGDEANPEFSYEKISLGEVDASYKMTYEKADRAYDAPLSVPRAGSEGGPDTLKPVPADGGEDVKVPDDQIGVLTAGRWNDNSNWGFFKNLVTTGRISFPVYDLDPVSRSAVTVKNESGAAVEGIKVEVVYSDDNSVIWSGISNKEGTAYLFLPTSADRTWKVRVYDAEGHVVYTGTEDYALSGKKEDGVPDSQSRTTGHPEEVALTIDSASKKYTDTQVMFILDTTGSMGDELTYLQADFGKIMERVTAPAVSYSWNFYRDEGDDYVTRTNGFETNVAVLKKLLYNESAAGGGDTPEAVAEILTETMNSKDWKADSKKIAFLIFDAPPHGEKSAVVAAAVAKAAEQGIHVVPIVASNADRTTELFGRALAIMTDGEYVFLTDDSGVGDSHLEPIIGDYEVQKLGDIIVDIINEFAVKAE